MTKVVLIVFLNASCGEAPKQGAYQWHNETICLSCIDRVPEKTPPLSGNGFVGATPDELSFVCVNYENCAVSLSVTIQNTMENAVKIEEPYIAQTGDAFSIVDTGLNYPYELVASMYIEIAFRWDARIYEGLLIFPGEVSIEVPLIGVVLLFS